MSAKVKEQIVGIVVWAGHDEQYDTHQIIVSVSPLALRDLKTNIIYGECRIDFLESDAGKVELKTK